MITGAIKNKVDKIWTDIWAGGITNPLTVIEQLTYLMFIRSLDEKELESKLFAIIACRAAIKAGDEIDRWSAEALLKKVFELDEPACPHGRTFLIKLSEKDLRIMVGRTQ